MSDGHDAPRPDPRPAPRRRSSILAALILAFVAACSAAYEPPVACGCSPTRPPTPPSPIQGVITGFQRDPYGTIESVSIRMANGDPITLSVGLLEGGSAAAADRLFEYQTTGRPVLVHYHVDTGTDPDFAAEFVDRIEPVP